MAKLIERRTTSSLGEKILASLFSFNSVSIVFPMIEIKIFKYRLRNKRWMLPVLFAFIGYIYRKSTGSRALYDTSRNISVEKASGSELENEEKSMRKRRLSVGSKSTAG